jgi:hypothetical protein
MAPRTYALQYEFLNSDLSKTARAMLSAELAPRIAGQLIARSPRR